MVNCVFPSLLMMASGRKHLPVTNVVHLLELSDDDCFEDNDSDRDSNYELDHVEPNRGDSDNRERHDYNEHMCGVDRLDQLISYYSPLCKTLKWYLYKVVLQVIDFAVTNTLLVYKQVGDTCRNICTGDPFPDIIRQLTS